MKNLQTDNSGEAFTFFALLYLPLFSFLYSALEPGNFLVIFFLFTVRHIPSFILLFFTHHYFLGKERRIPDSLYVLASMVLFIISFYVFAELTEEVPNVFPVINLPMIYLFLLGIIAHLLVYVFLRLIYKAVAYYRNKQNRL
jgi:hypothetical protein